MIEEEKEKQLERERRIKTLLKMKMVDARIKEEVARKEVEK